MGWARANVLFDLLAEPPKPGTPLESLMLLVWQMRQEIEFYKVSAVMNTLVGAATENVDEGNKTIKQAYEDLMDAFYPHQKGKRVRADQAALDVLRAETARGPLRVVPLQSTSKLRSKMKTRYVEREQENVRGKK